MQAMLAWMIFRNYMLSPRSGALVRVISWHCILGVGMGVAALIIVLSVMSGFNASIRGKMLSVEPHLVVSHKDEESVLKVLNNFGSGVESVDRFEHQDMILRSGEGVFGGVIAKGYQTETLHRVLVRIWKSGRQNTPSPQIDTAQLAADEVILGGDLARNLGVFEGDEVTLVPPETLLLPKGEIPKLQKFRIKSLVSTSMPELDQKLLFYNLDTYPKRMRSASSEGGFEIRLNKPNEADQAKTLLVGQKIKAETWGDRDNSLYFALKMESLAMTLFLSLAVFITSFSIVIVMVLLLSQKRQDIGMMMALGLSIRNARLIFLRVGLLLSLIGIGGGIILGSAVSLYLDWFPVEILPQDIYTDATLRADLTWQTILFVVVCSGLISIVGSWLPVWRYILSTPSEALRRAGR